jgi:hypothetical protein
MFRRFYAWAGLCCIIAFALVRRADFAISVAYGISNDQDVMDYSLNKASEELLKNSLHFETKNFIHNYLMHSFDWATLAQEWRNHKYSYGDKSESSAKSKHALTKQMEAIDALLDPSKKFMGQLNKIFNNETVDLVHADSSRFRYS